MGQRLQRGAGAADRAAGVLLLGRFWCANCWRSRQQRVGRTGRVFTPTLFVGAALGSIIGQLFGLWPGMDTAVPLLLALTGMATLLAATTHAPIMAALMVFEMTGEYALLPGILLSCVIATTVSRGLRPVSVYHSAPPPKREA